MNFMMPLLLLLVCVHGVSVRACSGCGLSVEVNGCL